MDRMKVEVELGGSLWAYVLGMVDGALASNWLGGGSDREVSGLIGMAEVKRASSVKARMMDKAQARMVKDRAFPGHWEECGLR